MPIALLRSLAQKHLPAILTADEDLEAARLLLSRHIEAVGQVVFDRFGVLPRPGLVVTAITPLGYLLLACLPSENKN